MFKGRDSASNESKSDAHDENFRGEYRRVGRGRLLDDISALSLTGGQGRALLFENVTKHIKSQSEKPETRQHLREKNEDNEEARNIEPSETKIIKQAPGTKGLPVQLECNYIRLTSDPDKGVYVYEVRFVPNVDSVHLRVKYLNEHKEKYGVTKSFNGVLLYLPILLKDKLTTFVSKSVADSSDIEIRICFKKKESLDNCIPLYNLLFDRVMKTLNYVRFDRKHFDPTTPKVIPHAKLEVWPGYITAIDEYDGGLMVCCDVSHRVLCQQTVFQFLVDLYQSDPNRFQDNAKKALIGCVVITRYNNRTYRIDDIHFDKSPQCLFRANQTEVSYMEYYKKNYNIAIKDKNQPLLISIKKAKGAQASESEDFVFCLIPELCFLTGLRDEIRSDCRLMREIVTFMRVAPNHRIAALEKFYRNINNCPEARAILKNWGLALDNKCETIGGRQLDEEKVYFAKSSFGVGATANFTKYAVRNELFKVVSLNNWLVIHTKRDTKCAQIFVELFFRNIKSLGICAQTPKVLTLDTDRVEHYVQALRANISKTCQMVVCICPVSREDRYAAIKKICCSEIPIPSQVINANTLLNVKNNNSIVQKIALQMNCKLGGSLWSLNIPFKNVMICGIDTYHDAAAKGNSVAAFVASLNSSYTNWYSKSVIQSRGEEIVNGLCSCFSAALLAYEKTNGKLPGNVIIYRDGVGDGQLRVCEKFEITQLENACKKLFPDYQLKLTFVVVQKRINTRYFRKSGNTVENPLPGTIIDTDITRRQLFDFFLVSQAVQHGTVTPTHYIVLRDDVSYSPDIIQRLTYKLCYLYYNWTGSIRVPACCQYAHKLAYLVGQFMKRNPAEELCDKLFYL